MALGEMTLNLRNFVRESNRIEGIRRAPMPHEIHAHESFLQLDRVTVDALVRFVGCVEPGAVLRNRFGRNVSVGRYVPPPGGPKIESDLRDLLGQAVRPASGKHAYLTHHAYENLHPFTDGNGRSGRALWLWMVAGNAPLGFLHQWYYHSLQVQPHGAIALLHESGH